MKKKATTRWRWCRRCLSLVGWTKRLEPHPTGIGKVRQPTVGDALCAAIITLAREPVPPSISHFSFAYSLAQTVKDDVDSMVVDQRHRSAMLIRQLAVEQSLELELGSFFCISLHPNCAAGRSRIASRLSQPLQAAPNQKCDG